MNRMLSDSLMRTKLSPKTTPKLVLFSADPQLPTPQNLHTHIFSIYPLPLNIEIQNFYSKNTGQKVSEYDQ